MFRIALLAGLAAVASLSVGAARAAEEHVVASPDQLKWGAAPAAFPKGAEIAVVTGDPSKEGAYVVRLRAKAGYKVPPHMHPNDENVTVLSGTFHIGMGDTIDESKSPPMKAGAFAHMPKGMHHFAFFSEDSVIQIHGLGPQGITYVNPADDPRKSN